MWSPYVGEGTKWKRWDIYQGPPPHSLSSPEIHFPPNPMRQINLCRGSQLLICFFLLLFSAFVIAFQSPTVSGRGSLQILGSSLWASHLLEILNLSSFNCFYNSNTFRQIFFPKYFFSPAFLIVGKGLAWNMLVWYFQKEKFTTLCFIFPNLTG